MQSVNLAENSNSPRVDVVILAFGREALLERCVSCVLSSEGVAVQVFLVNNGCDQILSGGVFSDPRVYIIQPGENLGFTGGCNQAASLGQSPFVVLVNSDALVEPGAIGNLIGSMQPDVGVCTGLVEILDSPGIVNSAGNPVHWSFLSWAGGLGEDMRQHLMPKKVASSSGALMAVHRNVWERLGGFNDAYFAYGEDTELSLRCWLLGLKVMFEPRAIARHDYEFSRNTSKFFLLERNRAITILTLYDLRTLILLMPGLILIDLGVWIAAIRGGWIQQKGHASLWTLRNWRRIWARRRLVQDEKTLGDASLLHVLELEIRPSKESGFTVPIHVNALLRWQGRFARKLASRKSTIANVRTQTL